MLQGGHSAILSTFIKLIFIINIFALSIYEWPLKIGFTVAEPVSVAQQAGKCSTFSKTLLKDFP